ncbi:MarR family winged helix-turn-helix transcriptional regulator [Tropicibacter naphthalenivorans]|uniref:Transcriptional regulator SlyA n=1 Tax=Tropicibacter naphthalenivorans TaxID=441103 RepID=A0A0P1GXP3_9RHOB|nr:MarR family transcriptional regulator [Tropicibacter naphthalenivorans]CUH80623.1 transcriptional regulator SlyA [Tropicibacter naphthalenivorans]SMC89087.1 DNA-binding transcriptional regulator, MarR family [Tropicibacter naphthalenivorans]
MTVDVDDLNALFTVEIEAEDGPPSRTLSFTRSPTVLLNFAANRFNRAAAKAYAQKFDIGIMDWRMLVMLTRVPGATVTQSAQTIGIDKAAISRSVARLEQRGLAVAGDVHANGRSRGWWLTEAGRALHDRVLVEALTRQKRLLDGFSPQEIATLTDMLGRFIDNLDRLNDDG